MLLVNKNWTKDKVWQGCVLASIAHAIMVSQYPDLSFEQSWNGITYSVQDGSSIRGSISFLDDYCVGCFRDELSNRLSKKNFTGYEKYFADFPIYVLETANNEALQYMLDEVDGKVIPLITNSFWCSCEGMFSNDNEKDLLANGLSILAKQLSEFEEAVEKLAEYYDMNERQVLLLSSLFNKKIQNPRQKIFISKKQAELIGFDDLEGIRQSEISFSELGFIFAPVL